jgi:hypothetical protein
MARDTEASYPGALTAISVEKTLLEEINDLIKITHELAFQIESLCDDALGAVPAQVAKAVDTGGYGQFGMTAGEIRSVRARVYDNMERLTHFRSRLGVKN